MHWHARASHPAAAIVFFLFFLARYVILSIRGGDEASSVPVLRLVYLAALSISEAQCEMLSHAFPLQFIPVRLTCANKSRI